MANPFDQFDSRANPFDQFEERRRPVEVPPQTMSFDPMGNATGTTEAEPQRTQMPYSEQLQNAARVIGQSAAGAASGAAQIGTGVGELLPAEYGGNASARATQALRGVGIPGMQEAGKFAGSMVPYAAGARAATMLGQAAMSRLPALQNIPAALQRIGGAAGAGAAGGAAEGIATPTGLEGQAGTDKKMEQAQLGAMLGGAVSGGVATALSPLVSRMTRQQSNVTPQMLRQQANEQYDLARSADILLKPQTFTDFSKSARQMAQDMAVDPVLQPRVARAFERISDLEGRPVSLNELDNLRKIFGQVGESASATERKMAQDLTGRLDDFISGIDPKRGVLIGKDQAAGSIEAFETARGLWSKQAKASKIEELIRRAELSAPNYSASGMENALRTEFRQLAKNQKQMRKFSPEEQQAIEAVAKGDVTTNALRMMGKLAPRGIVSGGVLVGMGAINPVLGAAAVAAGEVGKRGATARTTAAAERARDVMLGISQRPRALTREEEEMLRRLSVSPGAGISGLLD